MVLALNCITETLTALHCGSSQIWRCAINLRVSLFTVLDP